MMLYLITTDTIDYIRCTIAVCTTKKESIYEALFWEDTGIQDCYPCSERPTSCSSSRETQEEKSPYNLEIEFFGSSVQGIRLTFVMGDWKSFREALTFKLNWEA